MLTRTFPVEGWGLLIIALAMGMLGWLVAPVVRSGLPGSPTSDGMPSYRNDADIAFYRKRAEAADSTVAVLSSVVSKHLKNKDSAAHALSKFVAAVDSLPADRLQALLDSLFPDPARQPAAHHP